MLLKKKLFCTKCRKLEEILQQYEISYTIEITDGIAPALFYNGELLFYGLPTLEDYKKLWKIKQQLQAL